MMNRTMRLVLNLPPALHTMSVEELYHVAASMADELALRGEPAAPTAYRLAAELLEPARLLHRARLVQDTPAPTE